MSDFPAHWTQEQIDAYWEGLERALAAAPTLPEPDDEGDEYPEPLL